MNHTTTRSWPTGLVFAAAIAVSCFGAASSQAAIISNPGFQFVAGGHTNGDNASHSINLSTLNVPSWNPATISAQGFAPNVTDPQGIFANNPNEYLQIQIYGPSGGGSQDAYQQIVVPSGGQYLLSMDADRRSDNISLNGTVFLQLWSGNVSSFTSGSPITPDSSVSPTLTGSFQQFSRTYSLTAGNYTVRVGGTYVGPSTFFQAGIDNVNMSIIPEPSTYALIAAGAGMLLLRKRRAL